MDEKSLTGVWRGTAKRKVLFKIKDFKFEGSTIHTFSGVTLRQSGTHVTGTGHLLTSRLFMGGIPDHPDPDMFKIDPLKTKARAIKIKGSAVNSDVTLNISTKNIDGKLVGKLSSDGQTISGPLTSGNWNIMKQLLKIVFLQEVDRSTPGKLVALAGFAGLTMLPSGVMTVDGDFTLTRAIEPNPNPGEAVDVDVPITRPQAAPVKVDDKVPEPVM